MTGTAAKPRLAVFRSDKHIYAQAIDDGSGRTVAAASSLDAELKGPSSGGNVDRGESRRRRHRGRGSRTRGSSTWSSTAAATCTTDGSRLWPRRRAKPVSSSEENDVPDMNRDSVGELKDRVVHINRVTKVVKGGKNFSFSALVVVGDGNGWVGFASGKAREVPTAISKGVERAKRNLVLHPAQGLDDPARRRGAVRFGPGAPEACVPGNGRHRRWPRARGARIGGGAGHSDQIAGQREPAERRARDDRRVEDASERRPGREAPRQGRARARHGCGVMSAKKQPPASGKKTIRIRQVRSGIGFDKTQKATLRALGPRQDRSRPRRSRTIPRFAGWPPRFRISSSSRRTEEPS